MLLVPERSLCVFGWSDIDMALFGELSLKSQSLLL